MSNQKPKFKVGDKITYGATDEKRIGVIVSISVFPPTLSGTAQTERTRIRYLYRVEFKGKEEISRITNHGEKYMSLYVAPVWSFKWG